MKCTILQVALSIINEIKSIYKYESFSYQSLPVLILEMFKCPVLNWFWNNSKLVNYFTHQEVPFSLVYHNKIL